MNASLIMRDRETDSWWSIMTSTAIGGVLDGAQLDELPVGEKTTWGDWVDRYPQSLVLSVGGTEHRENNAYDSYFASDETFGNMEISDLRLGPKEPIFSFWLDGKTYAAPHEAFPGGRLFELPGDPDRKILLYREAGSPMFASTRAWVVAAAAGDIASLLAASKADGFTGTPLDGFDTFWYSWISVNSDSILLR